MACELCGIVYRVGTQWAYLTLFPGKLVVSGAAEMYDALAKVPNLNSEFWLEAGEAFRDAESASSGNSFGCHRINFLRTPVRPEREPSAGRAWRIKITNHSCDARPFRRLECGIRIV
jgi:hypothetical protein